MTDSTHHLLALWAADCAEHVLPLFEQVNPSDNRPRQAIEMVRAWVNGDIKMNQAHKAGLSMNSVAKGLPDAARFAALAAGQAVGVAHVAAHELGAAAYAIKAMMATVDVNEKDIMRQHECLWQRDRLPKGIRELVLEDQRLRNDICWNVFI